MVFWSTAYAQSAAAPTAQQPSMVEQLVPFAIMFFIVYFLFLRPQSKARKEQAQLLEKLKRGDRVVTYSGVLGRIENLDERTVTLEVSPNVKIPFLRTHIQRLDTPNAPKETKK